MQVNNKIKQLKNNCPPAVRILVFNMLFLLFCAAHAFAQDAEDCKKKLDEKNTATAIPDADLNDFEKYINVAEKYFYSLDSAFSKNAQQIEKKKAGLVKDSLTDGRKKSIQAEIDKLTNANKLLSNQKSGYKNTLIPALNKIINYFDIRNKQTEIKIYQDKLAKLVATK